MRMLRENGGLGLAALAYVAVDYLRHVSPALHAWLLPALWAALALAVLARVPFYQQWTAEIRAALPFLGSMLLLLCCCLLEMVCVRFVTAVLGLDYHRSAAPLPDTGQWFLLALNEKLPPIVVDILRSHIVALEHYLLLFIMLAFSVLFKYIKAPGLGLGARYMFTMAIGRLLRAITFISTILPSLRPWCAASRFQVPLHPHPWAQEYYMPYASDSIAIRRLIQSDIHYASVEEYPGEYQPNWGRMSFLASILRPTVPDGSSWYQLLTRASGGCNDLMYSGHMFVAVLTAMAWTILVDNLEDGMVTTKEAYGGWTSGIIWLLVMHSAQREVRERHHYSVDCVVAIYVGILLWKMTGFMWSSKDTSNARRLAKLDDVQGRLVHAAKDSDIDEIREILKEVELAGQEKQNFSQRSIWAFAGIALTFTFTAVILALTLTNDG
ncbi:uncharacterized protein M6B38_411590 [Iris pallida]|uniref:Sphingomyelin synthase-like domain-containing protein n=2 Tax=Iris pallida TaxID=29817 RepID=A0AAX6FM61_IRIPA|nr:uncharacterized protein M6B38_411590 [Iris pallida]